jgi:hypothetical protein
MTRAEYNECIDFVKSLKINQNLGLPIITIPPKAELQFGGIIGAATLTACVRESDSPWFTGEYGFVLENPRTLPLMRCQGSLKFFYPSY